MIPKFRVWLKEGECIKDVHSINFEEETVQCIENTIFIRTDSFEDVVLMQSTGLHDKNGKEIFEGDILNHPLQGMRKVYYPFTDRVASYGLENIENGMRSTLQDAHRLYEVIGNIHEHSRLLDNGGERDEQADELINKQD